jgi:ethanolamine ammonia-lyase small subunit
MSDDSKLPAAGEIWSELRRHTAARIGLGRCGASMPTAELLRFGLAHARARDAVWQPLDPAALEQELRSQGMDCVRVHSMATSREQYLLRPDLGRRLDEASLALLQSQPRCRLAVTIADGLSAEAAQRHARPVLLRWHALLRAAGMDQAQWPLAVVVAEGGRVALGDEVGAALGAALAVVMLGERPGLSSPDSLGIYLTFDPRPGRMDSERNCISNVRPQGLGYAAAADKLHYLAQQALSRGLSGVALKDDSELKHFGDDGDDGDDLLET